MDDIKLTLYNNQQFMRLGLAQKFEPGNLKIYPSSRVRTSDIKIIDNHYSLALFQLSYQGIIQFI